MTLPRREHPEAADEFDDAVRWYEAQEYGIGHKLVDRAQQTRRDIAQLPDAGRPFETVDDGTVIRSRAVRGYPNRILYSIESGVIVILAHAHERRKPGYWLHRLHS